MRAVGIFLGLLYGWIMVDFAWVSILGIIAMGTTGAMSVTESIQTSFMSPTFFMLVFPLILMAYLGESGFSNWLAYKMLSMNFLKGHPWRITTMFFLAASILTLFVTAYPAIFLMWSIFLGVAKVAGYKPGDKYIGFVLCSIVMLTGTIVSASTPWSFYTVTLHALMADSLNGYAFPAGPILVLGTIAQLLTIVLALFIGKFILRVDVSKMQEFPPEFYEKAKEVKLTFEGKVALLIMLALMVMMCMPSFFPNLAISKFFGELGLHGVAAVLLGILLVLRKKNGVPFAKMDKLSSSGMRWDLVLLTTSTLSLADLLKIPEVGILDKVTAVLIPFVSQLPPSIFIFATILIFWCITQVTHNFVVVLTMVGALAGVCVQIGINPWVFGWLFMCGMSFAYSTPAACSHGSLMFCHDWINKKDAYINGILFSALGIVVFTLVMLPLATWMFGTI